jgi:hypothetical protein
MNQNRLLTLSALLLGPVATLRGADAPMPGNTPSNVIRFNDRWESFTVLFDDPAIVFAGRKPIPSVKWKLLSVSSEETQSEISPATHAFDNDAGTFWHTRYTGGAEKCLTTGNGPVTITAADGLPPAQITLAP